MKKEKFELELSLEGFKHWVLHHEKESGGALILIVFLIILAVSSSVSSKKMNSLTEGEYSSSYLSQEAEKQRIEEKKEEVAAEYKEEEENTEITNLISAYYTAYCDGDTDTLSTLAKPLSDMEKGYVGVFSQYVESYQDISVYTKGGYEEDSYFVSVVYWLKFKDIDTLNPGMDFFYVQTAEDGTFYIDNVYSNFNLSSGEYELDDNVSSLIQEFEKADDVTALQKEVQENYDAALASDEALKTMMEETLPNAVSQWAKDYNAALNEAAKAEEEAKAAEEAAKAEEEAKAAEEAAKAEEEAKAAEEAAKAEEEAKAAEEAAKAAEEAAAAEEQQQETTTINYVDAGTVIRLKAATNIRESMSESADRVGVAFEGEQITVVQSYEEGWTKVTWGDKTGYVKTEVLLDQQ
jgi:hypothetical protein